MGIGSVGFSLVLADDFLCKNSRIGHFNFLRIKGLNLQNSSIGNFNLMTGYFNLEMSKDSMINNFNSFHGVKKKRLTYFLPSLKLNEKSKIMGHHYFDIVQDIEIGEKSIFAGAFTQCWTHGFIYGVEKQVRIDGAVKVGSNCYIGASCILLPGIAISDNITLGAGTICSKSLNKSGLYVSSELRYIPYNPDGRIKQLGKPMAVIDGSEKYLKIVKTSASI